METDLVFLFQHLFASILLDAAFQATSTILALFVVVFLILSFFISGAEIAFLSLNYRDINALRTKQDAGWKRIAQLLEEPKVLMTSLTVANGFVNIATIILANLLIDQILPQEMGAYTKLIIKIPAITFAIILFGEILPKIRATHNSLRTAYESASLVEVIYYAFRRLAGWLLGISEQIEKFFGGVPTQAYNQQVEEAIKSSVNEEDGQRMLTGIYKFRHITVKQIMKTRLDVNGIDFNFNYIQLKKQIEEQHYSRLPVYKVSLDDIVGMIHTKDIVPYLHEDANFDWHTLMRTPYFVHEHKYIEDLLQEFQSKRIHFAVVVDEFGGTSGIVTLEDILEEIIGEIKDEFDDDETANKKLDDSAYILEGRLMIHEACSLMNLPLDTFDDVRGESDSIAGLMLELAGVIPKAGDVLTVGDFEFTVLEVEKNRIQKVKLTIKIQEP